MFPYVFEFCTDYYTFGLDEYNYFQATPMNAGGSTEYSVQTFLSPFLFFLDNCP